MARSLQLVELVLDAIADAALQERGDVLIQLAVLPPQCGNRHDHGRLHVSQVKDRAGERVPEGPDPGDPPPWMRQAAGPAVAVRRSSLGNPWHHIGHVTSH